MKYITIAHDSEHYLLHLGVESALFNNIASRNKYTTDLNIKLNISISFSLTFRL
jgi:hypothetical protein